MGMGGSTSAISGAPIEQPLEKKLQNPKANPIKSAGKQILVAVYTSVKLMQMPNLAMITNMGIRLVLELPTKMMRMPPIRARP